MRAFTLALILLITACASLKYTDSGKAQKPLSIIFSSNRFNSLETCDCVLKKVGGLDREWNLTHRWLSSSVGELVAFTSGTTFVPLPKDYRPAKQKLYLQRSETLIESLNLLKISALSPSINDFRLGFSELQLLLQKATFPVVSSNLIDVGTRKPLFPQKLLLEQDGIRILVLGLSGIADPTYGKIAGVDLLPPLEALKEVLADVDPTKQLVVLLSSLSDSVREQVQIRFPQIHLILGAHHQSNTTFNVRQQTGSCLYLHPTGEGKTLSLIELEMRTPIVSFFNPWLATTTKDVRQIWENRINDAETQLKDEKLKEAERDELLKKKLEFQTYLERTDTIPLELNPSTISYRATTVELDENYTLPVNPISELLKPYKRDLKSSTAPQTNQN